jgi:exosortase
MDFPTNVKSHYSRNSRFLFLIIVSLFLFWRSITALLELAWRTDEYTHILLVLPVSLALIFLEGRNFKNLPPFAPGAGFVLILLSGATWSVIHLYSTVLGADTARALMIFALVLFWLGSIIGCYGFEVFKALLFPVLFLFLLVPIPGVLLDKVVVFLQQASTDVTFALFKLSGTPVMKDGFILSLPSLQIEVAKQCSGIRSSEMLLITGLILTHLFLRTLWSKIVFVAFIIPMAIAKNAIRIFTLAMLGIHVNPDFLEGRLHHEGGGVFFALALAVLLALLWALQRVEGRIARPLSSAAALETIGKTA